MELHQVLVTAAPGDAITTAAFELQKLLGKVGPSRIYAKYRHRAVEDRVAPLERLAERTSPSLDSDVLVFHASIGEPALFGFLRDRPERLVVDYHNISPAAAFYDYDPAFAGLLEAGRQELAALADRAPLALADSTYNADELRAMGYKDVRVAPLVVDARRLCSLPDTPPPVPSGEVPDGPVVLFVGQLLPHKRPDFLLQTLHVLDTYLDRGVSLVMVGVWRLPRYAAALDRAVAELNLRRVLMTGAIGDAELAAWYRRATVFLTASEHEGFCVPLLEAMAFGVPVVARAWGAVPETLGGAGVLLPADAGPLLAAEALSRVLEDGSLRLDLVERGRERLAHFDPDRAGAAVLAHLLDVVGS